MAKQKNSVKKLDFVYVFRPIYCFSRACGMMPFSILYDSKGEVQMPRITKCDGLWLIFSLCLYLSSVYLLYCNAQFSRYQHAPSYILLLGDFVLQMAILIFGILIIWLDMFNRFKLVSILKGFVAFDKEVGKHYCWQFYQLFESLIYFIFYI